MSHSDDGDEPPGPLLSRTFWLMMILAALCLAAGVTVGFYGPKLFPAGHALGAAPKGR